MKKSHNSQSYEFSDKQILRQAISCLIDCTTLYKNALMKLKQAKQVDYVFNVHHTCEFELYGG